MNILLTSVGRRAYIVSYFKEAFKDIGQVHAANSTETYAMYVADKAVITPLIYETAYIEFLLSYCAEQDISAIISLFDIDLPILAKNKKRFIENGVQVIVSDYKVIQICGDKWLTYLFLEGNGFFTPKTFLSIAECKTELEKGIIQFPLMIKPRWGMGSIGIYQADDLNELDILYKKTKRNIFDSYLRFESSFNPENSIIVQEKLIGKEYGLDVFNNLNGKFLTCIPKIKIAMRAGETDSAEIIDNSELYKLGKNLSQKLKHIANLDVDCFKIEDDYFVVEMNCRFGGQYPFCHLAGVNFPKAIMNMLMGNPVNKSFLKAKYGVIGIKDINPVRIK
jgi:carbamoyl-phosphate synthase large subunit